jgi:hypothetical protein
VSAIGSVTGAIIKLMADGLVETMIESGGQIHIVDFHKAFEASGLNEEFTNLVARRLTAQGIMIQDGNMLYLTSRCVTCNAPYAANIDTDYCKRHR